MDVNMIYFDRELQGLGDEIHAAIDDVIQRGWFILGDEVERFENRFANFVGTEFGIGVNSGTDALILALRALDVGSGDEVITVSHSATATSAAIVETGANPVYVDIDEKSMLMDTEAVESAITDNTAAIVPVHLYGDSVEMEPLERIRDKHDIPIVEDCAQAHGTRYRDTPVGSIGDCGAFSFYPTKNLGAYGDAGIVTTDDPEVATRLEKLREYGWDDRYNSEMAGINSRLDELQAAILNVKLEYLFEWNERRRTLAGIYDELLEDTPVTRPSRREQTHHIFHQYVIRTEQRDALRERLNQRGISTQIHYPVPNHQQVGYDTDQSLPTTEQVCDQVLSLPIHPTVRDEEVRAVGEAVRNTPQ